MKRTEMKRGTAGLKTTKPMNRGAIAVKKPGAEPKVRTRKCALKGCRERFAPRGMAHRACCPEHAESLVALDKASKIRKERQEGLAKLKRRADWLREAQAALNAWIRLVRDADKPCISCGRFHEGQFHAGHFLARGSHPNLAMVELNLAKQCMPCNVHLSGNQLAFRRGLVERVGLAAVEALESDTAPRKYSVEQLKEIRDSYRLKLREARK